MLLLYTMNAKKLLYCGHEKATRGEAVEQRIESRHEDRTDAPHGCCEGWVYLGFMTEEDGELVEITDRVPCRRCRG